MLLLDVLLLDVLLLDVLLLVVLLLEDGAVMALFVLLKELVELEEAVVLDEEDVLDVDDVVENSEDVLDVEIELDNAVKIVLGNEDEEELDSELTGCTPFCGLMQAEPAHDGPPTVRVSNTGFGSARSPDSLSAPSGVTSSYAKA